MSKEEQEPMRQVYEILNDMLFARDGSKEPDKIFAQVTALAQQIGFDYVRYKRKRPFPLGRPKFLIFDNLPDQRRDSIATLVEMSAAEKSSESLSHGMLPGGLIISRIKNDGIVGLTIHLSEGAGVYALFTLISAKHLEAQHELIMFAPFALISHLILSTTLDTSERQRKTALTEREREVLRWTGDGLTAEDIGEILSLSVNTVNFHLKTVKEKMSSRSKTSAVVQASLLGMLN